MIIDPRNDLVTAKACQHLHKKPKERSPTSSITIRQSYAWVKRVTLVHTTLEQDEVQVNPSLKAWHWSKEFKELWVAIESYKISTPCFDISVPYKLTPRTTTPLSSKDKTLKEHGLPGNQKASFSRLYEQQSKTMVLFQLKIIYPTSSADIL